MHFPRREDQSNLVISFIVQGKWFFNRFLTYFLELFEELTKLSRYSIQSYCQFVENSNETSWYRRHPFCSWDKLQSSLNSSWLRFYSESFCKRDQYQGRKDTITVPFWWCHWAEEPIFSRYFDCCWKHFLVRCSWFPSMTLQQFWRYTEWIFSFCCKHVLHIECECSLWASAECAPSSGLSSSPLQDRWDGKQIRIRVVPGGGY